MSGLITIQYQNATLAADVANIIVGSGGVFQLTSNQSLSLNGTFSFSGFSVTTTAISIDNTSTGVSINGSVSVQINAAHGDPSITANNFSGTATVTWPSSTPGGGYQQLTPGDPLTLTGFIN